MTEGAFNRPVLGAALGDNAFRQTLGGPLYSDIGGVVPPSGDGSLSDVVASTCCDLDATQSASYSGTGQKWANLATAPADGASQTDYDFFLGADGDASTDDPTFSTDKFTVDGGDMFNITVPTAKPQLLLDMPKTTSSWWGFFVIHIGATLLNNDYFFGTGFGDSVFIGTRSDGSLRIFQLTSTSGNISHDVAGVFSTDTTVLLGLSVDMTATSNNVRAWIDSSTKATSSQTWGTSTLDSADGAMIMARNGTATTPSQWMPSGDWIRSAALGNSFIDDADAALIIDALETRHGVDYTP